MLVKPVTRVDAVRRHHDGAGRTPDEPRCDDVRATDGAAWRRLRGARVLLVEDNEHQPAGRARSCWKTAGMVVDVADNGQVALEMVQRARITTWC